MTVPADSLRQHPFCRGLPPAHLQALSECATSVQFTSGQRVASEGTPADATYLLQSGRIALRSGRQTVETVEGDELLGWSWLIDKTRWHVDAVALGVVHAIRLDGRCLLERMDADPAFGYALTRCILSQVHRRLEGARLRSLDVFGDPS